MIKPCCEFGDVVCGQAWGYSYSMSSASDGQHTPKVYQDVKVYDSRNGMMVEQQTGDKPAVGLMAKVSEISRGINADRSRMEMPDMSHMRMPHTFGSAFHMPNIDDMFRVDQESLRDLARVSPLFRSLFPYDMVEYPDYILPPAVDGLPEYQEFPEDYVDYTEVPEQTEPTLENNFNDYTELPVESKVLQVGYNVPIQDRLNSNAQLEVGGDITVIEKDEDLLASKKQEVEDEETQKDIKEEKIEPEQVNEVSAEEPKLAAQIHDAQEVEVEYAASGYWDNFKWDAYTIATVAGIAAFTVITLAFMTCVCVRYCRSTKKVEFERPDNEVVVVKSISSLVDTPVMMANKMSSCDLNLDLVEASGKEVRPCSCNHSDI